MNLITTRKTIICRLLTCLALMTCINCTVMAQSPQTTLLSNPVLTSALTPALAPSFQTFCFIDNTYACSTTLFTGVLKEFEPVNLVTRTSSQTRFLQDKVMADNTEKNAGSNTQVRFAVKSLRQPVLQRGSNRVMKDPELSLFLHLNHSF